MKDKPKVSVVTVSYNQEKYIEEALQGFVMQKTNFEFEVLVSDDCSTDRTPEIIQKYASQYPNIIKPIFRKKNLGAIKNFVETMRAAKGDYIALCEGDDFWTDPRKLQLQADYLDNHPDATLCFHPVRVFLEGKSKNNDYIYPDITKGELIFNLENLVKSNFIQTNSVMYRRQNYNDLPVDILPLDWYLHLFHAQYGNIGYIDEVMAAYRRHQNGIWWGSASGDNDEVWKKFGMPHLRLFIEVGKLHGGNTEYTDVLNSHIYRAYEAIIRTDLRYSQHKLSEAISEFPTATAKYVYESFDQHQKAISDLKHHTDEQAKIIAHKMDVIAHQTEVIKNVEDLNQKLNSKLQIRIERAVKKRLSKRKSK